MTLHREGKSLLIIALIIVLGINSVVAYFFPEQVYVREGVVIITALFYLIILQFFRVPTRVTEINPQHIIAPADGKVVVIEETVENEYFKGVRRQVSIFMSPLNVHINFNPISGIVSYFKYHPGKFLVAWHPKSSTENERTTYVVVRLRGLWRSEFVGMQRKGMRSNKERNSASSNSVVGSISFYPSMLKFA
jgi:phosphatidylserine decarboxylase